MIDDPHLKTLHEALRAEDAAERRELDRLDGLPLEDQVAAGHAWPTLQLRELLPDGRRVGAVLQAARGVLLHDGLGPGDAVWLERGGTRLPGYVDWVERRSAQVLLDGRPPESLGPGPAWVRQRHDPSTSIRYRKALERADGHRSSLRRVLLETGRAQRPMETLAEVPHANESQRRAVAHALSAPDLAVIWGPPGTGKTWVLARLLAQLVAQGERPWALADSNAATDHLAAAAAAEGLHVVRLGPTRRISEAMAALRLEAHIERSLYGPALATLQRDLVRNFGKPGWGRLHKEWNTLYSQAKGEVLAGAEVIASTLGTLARVSEDLPPTVTAVVDEATQATEPAVWTVVPHVERLVLAGDPAQLGPVVRTPGVLQRSLLQRLLDSGVPAVMLEEQHRMAEPLRTLVSTVYGPRYTEAPGLGPRPAVLEQHALWLDTAGAGGELRDEQTCSLYEPLEVELVALLVGQMLESGVQPHEIGVIAPYSAQVARLQAHPVLEKLPVEVATVNAFQGREREVIIASFVRSNPHRELGFVADERRLTVALTRARRQLVLVGDVATLSAHPRYAELYERLAARDAVRSVWEPPYVDTLTR
jgi:ATP-dependent RNA/DNA helicase IGHMBP2